MIIKLTIDLEVPGQGAIYSKRHVISEDEGTYQELVVVNGSVDSPVSFGGVTTADVVYLTSDRALTYRCAVTDTAIGLDADRVHVLCGTNLTALLLSNSGDTDANVKVLVAGT